MISAHGGATTPRQDGFYLPADGCRLARLWLAWPAPELQDSIVALARAIAEFAALSVIVPTGQEKAARQHLGGVADIVPLPFTSARLRDTGPTFLVDGKGGSSAVNWRFNGWGQRAGNSDDDQNFAHALLGAVEVRRFRGALTLEASAFTSDGLNTLLALAPAVFDPRRNPEISRLQAFAVLQQWLGAERVIWLEEAHPDDALRTDVRALAAFIAPGRIVVSKADDTHPHGAMLAATARDLAKVRDAQGNRLEIIVLPAAPAAATASPRSYTGFLAINGGVLAPAYGAASDDIARGLLAEVFPGQDVRLVPVADLAAGGFSLSSLAVPHPARLLERDRASLLPRSAWSQPAPDAEAMLQKYIDLAATDK